MTKHQVHPYSDLIRGLEFYVQEIDILKARLTEIAGKNTSLTVSEDVAHYEIQFDIQYNNLKKLLHKIHATMSGLRHKLMHSGEEGEGALFEKAYNDLNDEYEAEQRILKTLRNEFYRFCAKTM